MQSFPDVFRFEDKRTRRSRAEVFAHRPDGRLRHAISVTVNVVGPRAESVNRIIDRQNYFASNHVVEDTMPLTLNGSIDVVLDLCHGDELSLSDAKADGIVALIHKASEGTTVRDPMYSKRRHEARAAGLLWGAYHFASGAPVQEQVENFLNAVQRGIDLEFDKRTLLCLDLKRVIAGPT